MNTAGGLTGGDRLNQEFDWGEQSRGMVTTLAAEKIYRSTGGPAYVTTKLRIAADADVEWLPQETILFDRSDLDRTLDVEMCGDATFLAVEVIIFGRTAMGETMTTGRLLDRWRIRRNGQLIYVDSLRLEGSPQAMLELPAVGNGARAIATLLLVAQDASARLEALRAVADRVLGRSAASSWNGLLLARFLAADGAALHQNLLPALAALRGERALPSAWRN
ncbi:urease accessory protein UreD [Sphingomonas oligophenolica]|uniref:Urease accessory protein UreD n=1 Tax=Sphingomonas oligophenolica TaxID=301154 RepID=A0ABU9YAX6_9SPHN